MINGQYEKEAAQFCEAIKELAQSENNLNNLEMYLSIHFDTWMKKYAYYPSGLVAELCNFADMD